MGLQYMLNPQAKLNHVLLSILNYTSFNMRQRGSRYKHTQSVYVFIQILAMNTYTALFM